MSAAEDPPFSVRAREAEGLTVLAFGGDLDVLGIAEAREAVRLAQETASRVLLDLRGLRFMDSSGLRVILEANRRATTEATELEIAPGEGAVRRVLDLSGVSGLVRLVDAPPEGP